VSGGTARFAVKVVPRGGRDAIDGVTAAGELRCRVSAAPADGAANKALLRLVAEACGVPPSAVVLEAGATSRTKRLRVDGVSADGLRARWPGLAVRS
jgi:uncharacterized protein YggU (UPF0235/DUF167 family)